MPIDLRSAVNSLSRVIPFLAQEKAQREQIRLWLERSLAENAAREESSRRLATDAARNSIAEKLAGGLVNYFQDVPGGQYMMGGQLKSVLPDLTTGIVAGPEDAARAGDINTNLVELYRQFGGGEPLDPVALRAVVGQVAGDIPQELVTKAAGNALDRSSQALTAEGQKLEASGQAIRREELAQKRTDAKKEPKTAFDSIVKEAQNDIETAIKQHAGVGQFFPSISEETKGALTATIRNAQSRIDKAYKDQGLQSPIRTEYEAAAFGGVVKKMYQTIGVMPKWYDLIYMGYDPDFVFSLQKELAGKTSGKKKAPSADEKAAQALIERVFGGYGKVE